MWYRLAHTDSWKCMDLPNLNFTGYSIREALVVGNAIVYFGSEYKNATFVVEKEEESEQLKVARED